jgi:hypothetical protein
LEHSDVRAFERMFPGTRTEGDSNIELIDDKGIPPILRNAFQYFGDIFLICNRQLPLADNRLLKQILDVDWPQHHGDAVYFVRNGG